MSADGSAASLPTVQLGVADQDAEPQVPLVDAAVAASSLQILLVEDEPSDAALITAMLAECDGAQHVVLTHVPDMPEALEALERAEFDCVLMDLNLPARAGVDNVTLLRDAQPDITIVVITSAAAQTDAVRALELGAQDFILKSSLDGPSIVRIVEHAITRNRLFQAVLDERTAAYELASRDPLTGLGNRAWFEEHAKRALAHARRDGSALALGFLDLNGFKQINDTQGHQAGDAVLEAVAKVLLADLREEDLCARFGGDEFVLVLAGVHGAQSPREAAQATCERLYSRLLAIPVPGADTGAQASLGLAVYPTDGSTYGELLEAADIAMYHGKRSDDGSGVHPYRQWMADADRDA